MSVGVIVEFRCVGRGNGLEEEAICCDLNTAQNGGGTKNMSYSFSTFDRHDMWLEVMASKELDKMK